MTSITRRIVIAGCTAILGFGGGWPVLGFGRQEAVPAQTVSDEAAATRTRALERVAGLVDRIAADARSLEDPKVRLTVQVQSAALLWPNSPDRARDVYVEAFEALLPATSAPSDVRQRAEVLRAELLAAVARRDPTLAEKLATRAAAADAAAATDPTSRAEMLAKLALEMVGSDPVRAAALGRQSLDERLTPSFVRFLVVLRGVDPVRADTLFGFALEVFARNPTPRIVDARELGDYLGANGQTHVDGVPPAAVRGFLEVAFRLIASTPVDSTDAAAAYFLGRTIGSAFPRYLPERAAELEMRLAVLGQSVGRGQAAGGLAEARTDSADMRRARAADDAIARDDYKSAHAEAAAIEDTDLKTRVYSAGVLRLIALRRFDDAAREIDQVPSPARRATLLVQLAHAAGARGDAAYAAASLSLAVRESLREPKTAQRLQALMSVVAGFTALDAMRGFETLETAVEAINKAMRSIDATTPGKQPPSPVSLNFDATFGKLAGEDFDRALLLAERFDPRAHRLLAELAVCRGGLASVGGQSDEDVSDDEVLSGG